MIFVNQLIEYNLDITHKERVLWLDVDENLVYVIDILNAKALPEKRFLSDLLNDLKDGIASLSNNDPYSFFIDDNSLTDKNKYIRDSRWDLIKDIVALEPDIYVSRKRGILLNKLKSESSTTLKQLYKLLRLYWIRGMTKNSLLPDYKHSGGKGVQKTVGTKKLGRPRKYKDTIGEGIVIDESIQYIFKVSAEKFYLSKNENPLTVAYDLMLKEYFTDVVDVENSEVVYKLRPLEELPSINQFRYWIENKYSVKDILISRKGSRNFNLNHRAVLGSSTAEAIGPGSLYQIDATIADVYLVSSYNRNHIIGRPVVYFVMDVFSRMITGVYCGLEGPSWIGAMMALSNAASDKVAFCKEYGIDISKDEWDTAYLPEAILGDRGELEGKNAESLISSLKIRVENTAPFRGDLKGIVEQQFNLMHGHIKPFVPGFVEKDHLTRTGKDYRLDAKLDLTQFTKIIINCVLFHNNQHWIKGYNLSAFMIGDEVDCIPSKLWRWGIKNRSGVLRTQSEDLIKVYLMPSSTATVTYRGIKFKGIYYTCTKAISEFWYEKARKKKSWKLNIGYDPRNTNYIYIKNDDGSYEECYLLESSISYKDKNIYEIDYELAFNEKQRLENLHEEKERKINLDAEIEDIVNEANKMAPSNHQNVSKKKRLETIKDNRQEEKRLNRDKESFVLVNQPLSDGIVIDFDKSHTIEDTKEDDENDLISLLKRKQKEGMNNV